MIILTPEEVRNRFGRFFYEGVITLVDPTNNKIEIVETFGFFPGSGEWTAINRCRAGGIVEYCELYGKTTVLRARIGESEVRFGPVDQEQGGQGLEGALIEGDTVRTKWAGIAGAGLSVAASLAQAPGVISACYPTEEDLQAGGRHTNRVEIITPRYEKITIGIDDTDDPEGGATWSLALNARHEAAGLEGVEPLFLRLAQLYPKSPYKTTNCTSTIMTFAVKPGIEDALIKTVADIVRSQTRSEDTGLAVLRGIGVPESLLAFGRETKKRMVSLEETAIFETWDNLRIIEIGKGTRGRIGALAALGLSERKDAAMLYSEPASHLVR